MTLNVSKEDDILEHTLSYHLARGVDFLVVVANKATDRTLEIVQRHVDAGVAHLIIEPGVAHHQSRWFTRASRKAATDFGADWIINADADEIYWTDTADLKTVLAAVPDEYGAVTIPFFNFLPSESEEGFFADRLVVREVRSLKPGGSSHLTKIAHRAHPDIVVSSGGHRISGADVVAVPGWHPISGLHFPFRSYAQFEQKIITAGKAAGAPDSRNGHRYELYRAGRLPDFWRLLVSGAPEAFVKYPPLDESDGHALEDGIAAGRLVRDTRVRDWFAQHSPAPVVRAEHREPAPDDVERVRLELMRAVHEYEMSPLRRERELRARAERRLKAIQNSRWWRLRPRLPGSR